MYFSLHLFHVFKVKGYPFFHVFKVKLKISGGNFSKINMRHCNRLWSDSATTPGDKDCRRSRAHAVANALSRLCTADFREDNTLLTYYLAYYFMPAYYL